MKQEKPTFNSNNSASDGLRESQANVRYIALLSSCFIALKNIGIYPPGHQQLDRCLDQVYKAIVIELQTQNPLVFGIAKDVFVFDELPIGSNNQSLTTLAKILSEQGIATIIFHQGLEKKSLNSFFQVLSGSSGKDADEQGIQQELLNTGCKHIDLLTINYNLFQLSDKSGKNIEQSVVQKGRRDSVWVDFTTRLMRESFREQHNSDDTAEGALARDPVELAKFINDNKLDTQTSLHNFGLMLDGMLGSAMNETERNYDNSEKPVNARLVDEEEVALIRTLLNELNPNIRKQFLETTLDKCQENIVSDRPPQLLSQLSSTMVSDLLGMVSEADREISPALLSLVQGLSVGQTGKALDVNKDISSHDMQTLMAREKREDYMDHEYEDLIQVLGQNQNPLHPPAGFILKDHEASLEDDYLIEHTTHLILALMGVTENEEDYSRYGQKIIEIALELPSFGNFALVDTIYELLSKHAASHHSPAMQSLARNFLKRIEGSEYVESIAALLVEASSEEKITVVQALIERGEQAVPELLGFYCDEQGLLLREELVSFFQKYRIKTLAEVVRRIPREKAKILLLFLALVKEVGVGSAAPLLHPLLTHHDDTVRMETLAVLLPGQDNGAIQFLRDMLHSSDETTMASAMTLIWRFKTIELLPDLLDLLSYRCLRQAVIQQNNRIILALSGIADPSALPFLEKLAESKFILHGREIANMKIALFRSLSTYPSESITPLCRKGLKSKQQEIKQTCKSLLSRTAKGKHS